MLDLGAGCGFLVEAANRWNLNCVGLEGSKEAVDIALKRYPHMDIRQHYLSDPLPFVDGSFCTVIMNQVIEHLEPVVAKITIREARRVLAPGGMLYIASPSIYNKKERTADPTNIHMYSPRELKYLLSDNGFGEIMALNDPLPILGNNRLSLEITTLLFRFTKWDRLSATANFLAFKPT
jgi:SAM-dependent methyltransferase